jgi:hypothetical protein
MRPGALPLRKGALVIEEIERPVFLAIGLGHVEVVQDSLGFPLRTPVVRLGSLRWSATQAAGHAAIVASQPDLAGAKRDGVARIGHHLLGGSRQDTNPVGIGG